ncbi:glycoside hydrolase family 38 N-terminal domain-containing protein [Chitinophaga rhizosphaerae]|uniref:glycoside hydrolase family 38 N-terminal domain-containing protein n=1 Tax=Chitinophaga rhizosphaerae TaxID=1864947 RepID=UPI00196B0FA1|nr:hypothetical protein [Chitinophaga rhizosphaerae]
MRMITIAALAACSLQAAAQKTVPYLGQIDWISGYEKEISGENIRYFSAFPDDANIALLTRATDGRKEIVWETAPVPAKVKGKYVYFSWVAGHSSATNSGTRHWDLYANNKKVLTFTTIQGNSNPNWSYAGPDSSRIVFMQTKRDGANDAHGLAFLRLPVSAVQPGKPVELKVVGQAQQSNDWFMTFKFTFQEKVDIAPQPFLLRNGKQPITLTALHFGMPRTFRVVAGNATYSFVATDGLSTFDVPVTPVQRADSIRIKVLDGKKVITDKFVQLTPVIHRELHFIHHSHTDIGYSHLQPEVLKIHLKNIDDALDMIASTKHYPDEAKFRWNIESLWAVEHWMKQAGPGRKAAFVQAVKNGDICLSALYANILTGLSLPEEMFHYTDYAQQLKKEFGFSIPSAMISDVPGYTWSTVTALAKGGVKYFSSGPNYLGENHPYLGDRVGHFVRTWGDKPVYWKSPSGEEKILFWTGAKGYSSWHGTAPGAIFDRGAKKIAEYLQELDNKNYPYPLVQWRYNVVADNGPIDTAISRFVKEWNEKYSSPKIVLSTPDRLFPAFEKQYGKDLPVVSGDITPYWEDGAASTAQEEGKNRVNSLRLQQIANAYAILSPKRYSGQQFYEAWTNILMFHEHTWGAHNSITQPDVDFVTEQWRIKKQFMQDGDQQTDALATFLLEPFTDATSKKIVVVNTHSWPASGPVEIQVAGASVKDANGKKSPLQKIHNGRYAFIAENVPPFGSAVYTVSGETVKAAIPFKRGAQSISNGFVSLAWHPGNGSITELSGPDGHNLAGQFGEQGLNSYWYVPGKDPAGAQTTPALTASVIDEGPVVTVISLKGEAPGARSLEKRIILYAGAKEAVIENIVDKKPVRSKEALHFGFPFGISSPKTTLDAGYGTMRYLGDQLPGSNMDFLYGRRWLNVSDDKRGVQWMLLETPMVEPGAMIDERLTISQSHKEWRKDGKPTATWFAYVMNNYWHTNYKSDQEGVSSYRYALRPHAESSGADMEKAAAMFTQPFLSFPLKAGATAPQSLFGLSNPAIIATSITPQEDGSLMVRLFNPEKTAQSTKFVWGSLKPSGIQRLQSSERSAPDADISLPAMGVHEFIIVP